MNFSNICRQGYKTLVDPTKGYGRTLGQYSWFSVLLLPFVDGPQQSLYGPPR